MNEITRNRVAGLTFWVAVWFMGLAGLALASVPGDETCLNNSAAAADYYTPAETSSVYVDADGSQTILRGLRPVVAR